METVTEYNSGRLRIVETRKEINIPVTRQIYLGMIPESMASHAWDIHYVSVRLAYHLNDGRCIDGRFCFENESGKQWILYLDSGTITFPKQSVMTAYVRKHFA